MSTAVWTVVILIAFCLFAVWLKELDSRYTRWLDSDRDPGTGTPAAREPPGRALGKALRAPGERRRREREEYERRLGSIPPEERTYRNPYLGKLLRCLLACVLSIAGFFGICFFCLPKIRATPYEGMAKLLGYLGVLLMGMTAYNGGIGLIAYTASYFQFRAFKRRHPGKEFDLDYFLAERKATNGGYTPSDFGK